MATSVLGAAGLLAATRAAATLDAQAVAPALPAEDGYKLWLRYPPPPAAALAGYRTLIRQVIVEGGSDSARATRTEAGTAIASILGAAVPAEQTGVKDGALVIGTPKNSPAIKSLGWDTNLEKLGPEGFLIRPATVNGHKVIAVASAGEVGALYGTFHLLRLMQTGRSISALDVAERPRIMLRMVNHWDNMDGTIERGYAGRSLWQWAELPGTISPRYADYARAMASIGMNATSINNVNTGRNMQIFSPEYLAKIAALADVFRPYGVRIYLAVNFAMPISIGGLKTADPLDPAVAAWWKTWVDGIYKSIPDFGGFLVKANSEGQPGPKDYKRTHAEGANVMADALAPHKGLVIWRAFVYDNDVDPDRAKRAYLEFTRLDGQFKPNVVVQVKNGPVDFQPREPFSPLFGAMKKSPVIAEVQATQEYLGQAKHLVYLGTMWDEFLQADTYAKGKGSTVAKVLEGAVDPMSVTGFVSVTNPGLDRNWCGHHFSQANWYAAGRFAWNPELRADAIADEWIRMTFTHDTKTLATIKDMMMRSREIYVNYTMPLGFHHLIGGPHYAPMPETGEPPQRPMDTNAAYYHQATTEAVGFDRTSKGDNYVGQYYPPVRDTWNSLATCPETYLLWFHRLPWDYKLKNGQTLWDGIVAHYYTGAKDAQGLQATWQTLAGQIDPQRHKEVADRLQIQVTDAAAWRDHCLQFFRQFSKRPINPPTK
jgi:alpha-glucuronidase